MPKKPYSNLAEEDKPRPIVISKNGPHVTVECSHCGFRLNRKGFHNHIGSKNCARRSDVRPEIERVEATVGEMEGKGKGPVSLTVSKALERRGLEEISGLEYADTYWHYEPTGAHEIIVETRPWIYEWVREGYAWHANKTVLSPNPMYDELIAIRDSNDPEGAVNMTILKWTEI